MTSLHYRHGASSRRGSTLVLAVGLDALAVALLALQVAVVTSGESEPADTFFSDPLAAGLLLTAATLTIVAAVVAAVSLWREPLRSRAGRWATRLAVANALFLPVLAVVAAGVAWAVGIDEPATLAQPLVPLWMLAGLGAVALGVLAPEPGRRGILVVPFMLGAFALVFWLGELLVPH